MLTFNCNQINNHWIETILSLLSYGGHYIEDVYKVKNIRGHGQG